VTLIKAVKWIRKVFSDSDLDPKMVFWIRIRILSLIFCSDIFLNSATSAYLCSGTCTTEKSVKQYFRFGSVQKVRILSDWHSDFGSDPQFGKVQ
jgi:hypothetical protein